MAKNNKILKSLIGTVYNRLTISSEAFSEISGGKKRRFVLCECQCGAKRKVLLNSLMSGHTQSCGCVQLIYEEREKAKLIRIVHRGMCERCGNPTHDSYPKYGGKGIKVTPKWKVFANFYNDMHESWRKGLQIDRINSKGDYEKSNCRWVDIPTQQRNKSNVKLTEENVISIRKSNLSVNELAEIFSVKANHIYRIKNNTRWKLEIPS
jgi:hypothetical protein